MIDGIDILNYTLSEVELDSSLNLGLERLYLYTLDTYLNFTEGIRGISDRIGDVITIFFNNFSESFNILCMGGKNYVSLLKCHIVLFLDECKISISRIFEVLKFLKNIFIFGGARVRSWGLVGGVCFTESGYYYFDFPKIPTISIDWYQPLRYIYNYEFNFTPDDILYFTIYRGLTWFDGIKNLLLYHYIVPSVPHIALDHIMSDFRALAQSFRVFAQYFRKYEPANVGTKFFHESTHRPSHSPSHMTDLLLNRAQADHTEWSYKYKVIMLTDYLVILILLTYGILLNVYKPVKYKNHCKSKNQINFETTLNPDSKLFDSKLILNFSQLDPFYYSNIDLNATVMMVQMETPTEEDKLDSSVSDTDKEREYSSASESDNHVPRSRCPPTPSSTPKEKRHMSRRKGPPVQYHPYQKVDDDLEDDVEGDSQIYSFSKKLLSISPCLTPSQRLEKRFRSFSQTSDKSTYSQLSDLSLSSDKSTYSQPSEASICSRLNDGSTEKKSSQTQKLISENGSYHLDKDKSCHFHYMIDMISCEEVDNILSDINTNISLE